MVKNNLNNNLQNNLKCPYCKKVNSSDKKGLWPFCTERCKNLDFGAWSSENYKITKSSEQHSNEQELENIIKLEK